MTKTTRQPSNVSNAEQQTHVQHQWLHRLINRRSYQLSVFVIVCILNVVDLLVDWYFFMSKTTIQKGLVFGPPPRNTLLAIFSFCIISTFTSILEIIQISRDTYQKRVTSLFGQITSCLTLWLEDVPLLTLNLLIVICRDGEVTYISLAKAFVGVFAALLRLLSIVLNKWLIRHDYRRKDHLSQFFNATSTVGVVLVFILSISIHIIASLPIDNFGHVYVEKPSSFKQLKFAHQKYFHHVGLYLQASTEDNGKYIYLTDIENIIDKGSKTFLYGINENENIFCVKQVNQTCFIQSNESTIERYDKPLTNKLINYSLTFEFKQPDFYYLLGDINYNIVRCDLKNVYINDAKFVLHYYRLKDTLNRTQLPVLLNEKNTSYRYYDVNKDFEPIEYLWRTGLSRCSTTSSYSPHRSSIISINNCF